MGYAPCTIQYKFKYVILNYKWSTLCGFISIHFSMGQSKRRLKLDYSPLPPPCRERNRNIAEVIVNILPKMTCCLLPSFLSICTKDMFTHQIKICISAAEIQGWASDFGRGFATCVQQIHVRVSPCHSIGLVLVVFIKNMWHPCRNFFTASKQDFETPIHMHRCKSSDVGLESHWKMCVNIPQVLWSQQHQHWFVQTLATMWRKGSCFFFFFFTGDVFYWHLTGQLI